MITKKNWGFSAYIDRGFIGRGYKVFFYRTTGDSTLGQGKLEVLKCPEIVEVPEYQEMPPDTGFLFDDTELQRLMDQIWNLGIRPTEGHGSTGQIAAVENHLKAVSLTHDRLLSLIEKRWEK